ncbi:hypothetical protein [uncultured Hymenobacter sp.]|uniref:hypothetical protein n=1 Tax=uncultured Hymenobacter sp. TaxID=170016 RepID=UPI0035CC232B
MQPASRTIYFENQAGRIWEEPADYLRLDYRAGARSAEQLQALLTHLLRALVRRGWHRALINQQEMVPFSVAEQAWLVEQWLPRAVLEGGYRRGAVLVAQNGLARLAMTTVVAATRHLPHTYQTFELEADALAWLLAAGPDPGRPIQAPLAASAKPAPNSALTGSVVPYPPLRP